MRAIAAILLALGAVEGTAYWWMHPAAAGQGEPVLVYRPSRITAVPPADHKSGAPDQGPEIVDRGSKIEDENDTRTSSSSSTDHRSLLTDHSVTNTAPPTPSPPSTLNPQPATSSITYLPDIVKKSLPSLRCSTGYAARIDREDGPAIHVAFFEWNLTDSTSVLECFKHLPEQCLGSIGMTLTGVLPPRSYNVGGKNLSFDHTLFRDPRGVVVHAFKGTWVSGADSLIGKGFRGGAEQSRQIRWKAALNRFRPAYACVAQGAVRGIPSPDLAWQAFERNMLADLKFESSP